MKSLSKVYTPASNTELKSWNVSDLDIESKALPGDDQTEQILALFGMGSKAKSNKKESGSRSTLHPQATHLSLEKWLPDELGLQLHADETEQWDFAQASNDVLDIPGQQIRKEKFDAEKERVELINQARAQADEILHEAYQEADRIRQQLKGEIEQAKQNGYESAREELQGALAATHAIVEETRRWQTEFTGNGEQILTEMLKAIAQSMFGEGVRLDANALQINLNRVMENAQRLGDLNIYLNPQDADLLDPSWSKYQLLITGNNVRIIPSEKIKRGGCIVKGMTGMVDARVETQLAAVLNTLDETSEAGK
jgi:flagellar biosynthesis/type III secretory pathway protein FliH